MTKTLREGEHTMAPTHIPTASAHESQSQHSPLPWRFLGGETARYITDSRGSVVAPVAALMSQSLDMTREDAALIVRCVNSHDVMLSALKHVRAWLCDGGPIQDDGMTNRMFVKANNAVHAAIANAEGT